MPSNTLPARPQVTRAQLQQAFPNNPQMVLAMERLLQTVGTPESGTVNSTGELLPFAGSVAPPGWLIADGAEVGVANFPNLFAVIGRTWGPGDGLTTFNLPDMRGRTLVGASATIPLGSAGGSATATITIANLPAHNHGVTDPGHTHVVTDPQHTHTVTDPQHAHGITDPGHHHTAFVSGTNELALDAGSTGASSASGNTGTAATGITVNSAATGITNQAAATGITNQPANTGITTQNTGNGTPIATLSPYAAVNWLIKT